MAMGRDFRGFPQACHQTVRPGNTLTGQCRTRARGPVSADNAATERNVDAAMKSKV